MLCFRKLPVADKILDNRRRGYRDFPSNVFLSHCAEKTRRGKLLCCVSENFRQRKRLWIRGGYQIFPSKVFCTTMPKTLGREPFCVVFQKTSGSQ